jgi:uncharacterized lipoprotein YddW (UPF0748 family)
MRSLTLRSIILPLIAVLGLTPGCRAQPVPLSDDELRAIPPAPREFRAAWIATVANIDWPSRPGLSTEEQKAELVRIMDRAAELNLNALIFQVRPACDAMYESSLEPWSEFLTGTMGKAPEPFYDPLAFAIEEAHRRGIELHAWFNPYRARHPQGKSAVSEDHISKKRPELVRQYGRYLWLDPGEKAVQDHSIAVMLDVARRYDVDGIHIDDYFYPYRERGPDGKILDFPDERSWQEYRAGGGTLSRDDWRRENVNAFIRRLYAELKQVKPHVKFGISPFGIYRPGHPPGVQGLDQYSELYADALKWLHEGWLDYWTPQLYWKIDARAQSYPVLLRYWVGENRHGRHIWPGNFTSKVLEDWTVSEILEQVRLTRRQEGATGNVHFSFKALQRSQALADGLKELYAVRAIPPASPWLDGSAPAPPALELEVEPDGLSVTARWKPGDGEQPFLWALYTRPAGQWRTHVLPGAYREAKLRLSGASETEYAVAIAAVDRCGNESARSGLKVRLKKAAASGAGPVSRP